MNGSAETGSRPAAPVWVAGLVRIIFILDILDS